MALYLLRTTAVLENRFSTRMKMLRATISDEFLHSADVNDVDPNNGPLDIF
ncbi:hypothetical protein Holit_00571 [Hollandina sp. SP2]